MSGSLSKKRLKTCGNAAQSFLNHSSLEKRIDSGLGHSKTSSAEPAMSSDGDETVINSDDWDRLQHSPPSESLLSHRNIDTHFETLSIVKKTQDSAAQTDLILPNEDSERNQVVYKHVQLLRGLLSAKQFAIGHRPGRRGKENVYPMVATKRGPKRTSTLNYGRKPKLIANGEKMVELVDISSSPETNDKGRGRKGSPVKPRRLDMDAVEGTVGAGTEPLRYALRHAGQDDETVQALQSVVDYVAEETLTRTEYGTDNWTGSLLELSADTLVRTANAEGVRSVRLVTRLCRQLLDSIVLEKQVLQAGRLEGLSNMILKLCESSAVATGVIDMVVSVLVRAEDVLTDGKAQLVDSVAMLESLFLVLRILAALLKRFEDKSDDTGSPRLAKPKEEASVLTLWRNHWRPAGGDSATPKHNQPSPALTSRLHKLEHLLQVSLERAPLLSPLLMACMESTRRVHFRESSLHPG